MTKEKMIELHNKIKIGKIDYNSVAKIVDDLSIDEIKEMKEYYKTQNEELSQILEQYRVEIEEIREKIYNKISNKK